MKREKYKISDRQLSITDDLNERFVDAQVLDHVEALKERKRIDLLERTINKDYVVKVITPKNDLTGNPVNTRLTTTAGLKDVLDEKERIKLLERVFKGERDTYLRKLRNGVRIKIYIK